MRSSTYAALFAGSAAAQSSVNLFNFFQADRTLTQIGADATATTYTNDCTAGGISVVPSALRPTPDGPSATITPAPTPRARLARQASASASAGSDDEDIPDYSFCEPYTLKQGSSTWEFHLKDPSPGAWTADMNCKWQGAITDADLTCTVTQSGFVPDASVRGVSSSVLGKSEVASMELIQAVAIVSASQTSSGSLSTSAAPSGSASGTAGAARSTGLGPGPAGPLPTGGMLFVGGAAGVFAAALAL